MQGVLSHLDAVDAFVLHLVLVPHPTHIISNFTLDIAQKDLHGCKPFLLSTFANDLVVELRNRHPLHYVDSTTLPVHAVM